MTQADLAAFLADARAARAFKAAVDPLLAREGRPGVTPDLAGIYARGAWTPEAAAAHVLRCRAGWRA